MAPFASLGLLLGILIGLSRESTVKDFIPILITFAGGSAIGFFSNKSAEQRRNANCAILALSLGSIAGVLSGIFLADNQLLTVSAAKRAKRESIEDGKYLRGAEIKQIQSIEEQVRVHGYPKDKAYDDIVKLYNTP